MPQSGEVAIALVNRIFKRPVKLCVRENGFGVKFLVGKDDSFETHRVGGFGNTRGVVVVVPAAIDQRLIDNVELCHWMPFPIFRR